MATVRITQGFEADLDIVESDKVLNKILDTLEVLETIPSMGSRDVPESISKTFGVEVHKIPVNPFDIITIYDEKEDVVSVLGLIHQRAAY